MEVERPRMRSFATACSVTWWIIFHQMILIFSFFIYWPACSVAWWIISHHMFRSIFNAHIFRLLKMECYYNLMFKWEEKTGFYFSLCVWIWELSLPQRVRYFPKDNSEPWKTQHLINVQHKLCWCSHFLCCVLQQKLRRLLPQNKTNLPQITIDYLCPKKKLVSYKQ